jgi:hypothetical protein
MALLSYFDDRVPATGLRAEACHASGMPLGVDGALVVVVAALDEVTTFRGLPASCRRPPDRHPCGGAPTEFASSTPGRCRVGQPLSASVRATRDPHTAHAVAGSRARRRALRAAARIRAARAAFCKRFGLTGGPPSQLGPGKRGRTARVGGIPREPTGVATTISCAQILWLPALNLVVLPDPQPGAGRLTCTNGTRLLVPLVLCRQRRERLRINKSRGIAVSRETRSRRMTARRTQWATGNSH